MNILLLIDALACGGAETHVCTLATSLAAQGHRVTVLSAGGAMEKELDGTCVQALHFPTPTGTSNPFAWLRLARFVCRLCKKERFDVLHAHTRRTALLVRLCRLLGPSPRPVRAPYRKSTMRRLAAPVTIVTAHAKFSPSHRRLSFWGDATVAVSEDLAAHTAQAFNLPRTRIRVIPNGIDLARFCPARRTNNRPANTLRITFASRLDGDCSAAAFALLMLGKTWKTRLAARGLDLSLCIAGGGECLDELRRRARSLPFVRLLGNVERMQELLQETDVLVGVSRVALEGAACGCAVILAGNEGARGLLTDRNFPLCAKDNFSCRSAPHAPPSPHAADPETDQARALAQVLDRALDELLALTPDERAAMTDRIRELLALHYGDAKMAADTLALYRKTLTAHRRVALLIGGYAGCGNLGDDAVLRCLCSRWQGKAVPQDLTGGGALGIPCATLRVSALVGRDARNFPLRCLDRRRPLQELRRADVFVLGGGALLQNCSRHGNRSLAYYLALALLARLAGCPWYIVGGAGPIRGRLARTLAAAVVRTAHRAAVRDTPSRELLLALGLAPERICEGRDPVCSVTPAPTKEVEALLRRLSLGGRKERLICVAPHGRTPDVQAIADRIARHLGAFPLFFAFDKREDEPICRKLQSMCGGAVFPMESLDFADCPEAYLAGIFALARAHGVLAGRLHALILAFAASVPAAPLDNGTPDPKLEAFCKVTRGAFGRTEPQAICEKSPPETPENF